MRVLETSLDEDLSLFSRWLWQQRVAHRIFEERGSQVLEVADAAHGEAVRGAYRAWRSGSLSLQAEAQPPAAGTAVRWHRALARYPGLTLLIALACLALPFSYPLARGELTAVAAWLAIVDLSRATPPLPGLLDLLAQGQVWRWFTPVFLHFGAAHLAFNCAITIYLGRRVEDALGILGLWLPVLVIGVASNLTQYAIGGNPVFGGLSGVAYGLIGFVLVMGRRQPDRLVWQIPPAMAVMLLAFLVLFSTGVTERFGLFVANAAHWSGLLAGVLLGAVWPRTADA